MRKGTDPKQKSTTYTLQAVLDEYLGPKDQQAPHLTLRPTSVALYWQLERWLESSRAALGQMGLISGEQLPRGGAVQRRRCCLSPLARTTAPTSSYPPATELSRLWNWNNDYGKNDLA
jgi:hypothetical protein